MAKKQRRWKAAEKLQILKEAEVFGMSQTIRKYGISSTSFYRWKEKYEQHGEEGLLPKREDNDPEKKSIIEENKRLRQIVSDLALELKIKDELLKKTFPPSRGEKK